MIQYAPALTLIQDSTKEGPIYTAGRERECCGQIFWKCCNGAAGLHNRFDNRYPATGTGLQVNSANFFTQGKWRFWTGDLLWRSYFTLITFENSSSHLTEIICIILLSSFLSFTLKPKSVAKFYFFIVNNMVLSPFQKDQNAPPKHRSLSEHWSFVKLFIKDGLSLLFDVSAT